METIGAIVDICTDCLAAEAALGQATYHEEELVKTGVYEALTVALNEHNALEWYTIHHTKSVIEDICESLIDLRRK